MLTEPAFIVSGTSTVLEANSAARRLCGADPVGRELSELVITPRGQFESWLQRCSGTAQPLVGVITFAPGGAAQGASGAVTGGGAGTRLRAYGARLSGAGAEDDGEPIHIGVRCVPHHADEFSVLARKVRELNAEIHVRRRTQAVLEESLARNELLLRELHHRVRNNLQMLSGLFSAAQREAGSDEVRRFLADANRRLVALGAAQRLMYRSEGFRVLPTAGFLTALCDAARATLGPEVSLAVSADDADISNETALPLALILNELVTNAARHGLAGNAGRIAVSLRLEDAVFSLVVEDSGPGFPPDAGSGRRSSGLGLVRGLCRQISGTLEIGALGHGSCTVRFPAHAA